VLSRERDRFEVLATCNGQQQADGQRSSAQPARRGDLAAQVVGREEADRSESTTEAVEHIEARDACSEAWL
jgi:hypothetical protein